MKNIRAVLFDMDGLLIDTESQSMRSAYQVGQELGITIDIPTMARAVMGTRRETVLAAYGSVLPDWVDVADFYQRKVAGMYELRKTEGIPAMKGAKELLQYLTEHGIVCVLATSTREESAINSLTQSGLLDYLPLRITGDMVENGKPHPEAYLKAAALAGVPIEECLVLEDSVLGIQSGRAAGAVVGMVPDCIPYDESCAPYCDEVFGSLLDVIGWLEA